MSCSNMSVLHCWRTRKIASGTAPSAWRSRCAREARGAAPDPAAHAASSSAIHSARNSRRRLLGASRDTTAMNRRTHLRMAFTRPQAAEVLETLERGLERDGARLRDLVVAACRPLLAPRDLLALPVRADEAERVEAAQRRIHRAGLQAGVVRDVEAVADAVGDGLQHERGRVSDVAHGCVR